MFAVWGRAMVRARWVVLALGLALAVTGAVWGTGVLDMVTTGGELAAHSDAARARERIERELGSQDADLLVLYSSRTSTVDDPAFRAAVTGALDRLRARPEVGAVTSYYGTAEAADHGTAEAADHGTAEAADHGTGAAALVSRDRHATYAVIRLTAGTDDGKARQFRTVRTLARATAPAGSAPGGTGAAATDVRTEVGGLRAFADEAHGQIGADLARAEKLSLPVVLVLLIIIFGGLVAAGMPLMIGVLAIMGGFTATRIITWFTDVSVFAVNIITLIGLGMAIDYALFIVSRFREELAGGHAPPAAVERTLATAGRTVAVSGITVVLSLATLLIFPRLLLRSLGLGGMAAVSVAMLASLTVLPALLAVLGHRVNALRVPLPGDRARAARRARRAARPGYEGGWARLAGSVMARPWWYIAGVLVVLAVLASPFRQVSFGGVDERILPASSQSRQVAERIGTEFDGASTAPILVLVSGVRDRATVPDLLARIARVPDVTGTRVAAARDGSVLVSVSYTGEAGGSPAKRVVADLRRLEPPQGAELSVAGFSADLADALESIGARLPWMILIVVTVTFLLLFLAFGSVVLPAKAIIMNVVSISASFGVIVWIFQEGHLSGPLEFTATGSLDPDNLILMLAVLFGLSTDYEVFLLSRVREQWDATGENRLSVRLGLQRTGGIITSAALLLMTVVGGFTTGGVMYIKMLGAGMLIAILVDATLVRALLVPATMRLIGRWNWWAPGPLARVYRRYGIREGAPARPAATGTG